VRSPHPVRTLVPFSRLRSAVRALEELFPFISALVLEITRRPIHFSPTPTSRFSGLDLKVDLSSSGFWPELRHRLLLSLRSVSVSQSSS